MAEEKENIENLFEEKFKGFELESPSHEWTAMSGKLAKMNFLKFGFAQFNIYYAIVALVVITSGVIIGISSGSGSENINNKTVIETDAANDDESIHPDDEKSSTNVESTFDATAGDDITEDYIETTRMESSGTDNESVKSANESTKIIGGSNRAKTTDQNQSTVTGNSNTNETAGEKTPELNKLENDQVKSIESVNNSDTSKKNPIRRKVIIEQQDTVFVPDTVHVKKRKDRRKK